MGLRSKTVTIASAAAGLAIFSQAPEFAQQYRQRIGGAVDELKTVVVDFDKDAANSQLSRSRALNKLTSSSEQFARDRGQSMTKTIGRFERLNEQQEWLENSHPLTRPLLVFRNPDSQVLDRAWEIYSPAVPLNTPGALYGGLGAILAFLLARFGIGGTRRIAQRRSDKKLVGGIESSALIETKAAESVAVDEDVTIFGDEDEPYPGKIITADDLENASRLAQRTDQSLSHGRGIPDPLQKAPIRAANVPYLKIDETSERKKATEKNTIESRADGSPTKKH